MYNNWEDLEKSIEGCQKCKLGATRTNIVFGVGNKNAKIMFIGEGPGADEDAQRRTICRKSWTTYE
jgi:DNA polymerase